MRARAGGILTAPYSGFIATSEESQTISPANELYWRFLSCFIITIIIIIISIEDEVARRR